MKIEHIGLQIYGANQYIIPTTRLRTEIKPRFRVKKLKRVWYIPIEYPVMISIVLWVIFGIYYAFCIYPMQSLFITLILLTSLAWASVLSDK